MNIVKKTTERFHLFLRACLASRVMKRSGFELSKLDFFHSFFYGLDERQITKKHSIHADAYVTFVVKRNGP